MKSFVPSLVLALLLAAGFAVSAQAQSFHMPRGSQAHFPKNTKKKEPPKVQYNVITAVDATAGTVTIKQVGGTSNVERTLRVTNFTDIQLEGQKAKLAQVQKGMAVIYGLGMDPSVASQLSLKTSLPPGAEAEKTSTK